MSDLFFPLFLHFVLFQFLSVKKGGTPFLFCFCFDSYRELDFNPLNLIEKCQRVMIFFLNWLISAIFRYALTAILRVRLQFNKSKWKMSASNETFFLNWLRSAVRENSINKQGKVLFPKIAIIKRNKIQIFSKTWDD